MTKGKKETEGTTVAAETEEPEVTAVTELTTQVTAEPDGTAEETTKKGDETTAKPAENSDDGADTKDKEAQSIYDDLFGDEKPEEEEDDEEVFR